MTNFVSCQANPNPIGRTGVERWSPELNFFWKALLLLVGVGQSRTPPPKGSSSRWVHLLISFCLVVLLPAVFWLAVFWGAIYALDITFQRPGVITAVVAFGLMSLLTFIFAMLHSGNRNDE